MFFGICIVTPDLFGIICIIYRMVSMLIPVIIGFGVLFFLIGLARYILHADSTEGRKSARDIMIWGVIIIFVMVSLWGLVNLLIWTVGLQLANNLPPNVPTLPTP